MNHNMKYPGIHEQMYAKKSDSYHLPALRNASKPVGKDWLARIRCLSLKKIRYETRYPHTVTRLLTGARL